MTHHILTNIEEIASKIAGLTLVDTTDDGWTNYYKDENNEGWCKFHIETDYHGSGQPVLLNLPEPSQTELMDYALDSTDLKKIATCAALLYYNERDRDMLFRELLIDRLENYISGKEWTTELSQKIKTIIYESNLYDDNNLRPVEGKTLSEINNDYSFYKGISKRAKQILTTANSN